MPTWDGLFAVIASFIAQENGVDLDQLIGFGSGIIMDEIWNRLAMIGQVSVEWEIEEALSDIDASILEQNDP